MDYALNEQKIAQYLIARDLPGLFELLLRLKGLKIKQSLYTSLALCSWRTKHTLLAEMYRRKNSPC